MTLLNVNPRIFIIINLFIYLFVVFLEIFAALIQEPTIFTFETLKNKLFFCKNVIIAYPSETMTILYSFSCLLWHHVLLKPTLTRILCTVELNMFTRVQLDQDNKDRTKERSLRFVTITTITTNN